MAEKPGKKSEQKRTTDPFKDVKRYIDIALKQATEEGKRHMSALIEHTDDRIAGIGERFVDFDRKLNSHTEMLVELAEDVSILKTDVSVLKEDVSVLKEDVSVLKTDVSVLKGDMSVVKKDISIIKVDMKKKTDRGEFIVLERRVSLIELK